MLNLLACELFGREMEIDASKVDWHCVLAEANRHVLTAFLYPGLRRLNGVPEEILSRARNAAMLSAARMEEPLRAQDGVLELMRSRRIPCAVLKGFSAACRYPHPELRVPGDIDLLVGNENLERACAALEQAGYRRDHETEMHVNFVGSGLSLEVHRSASVFPDTEKGRAARAYMEQALRHTEPVELHGYAIPVLAVPYQLVSLLAHMERHMGQAGIGLRQICDWAVAVQARRAQIGEDELQTLERCGLLPFAQVITKLCERYLGLPPLAWAQGAPDALDAAPSRCGHRGSCERIEPAGEDACEPCRSAPWATWAEPCRVPRCLSAPLFSCSKEGVIGRSTPLGRAGGGSFRVAQKKRS